MGCSNGSCLKLLDSEVRKGIKNLNEESLESCWIEGNMNKRGSHSAILSVKGV